MTKCHECGNYLQEIKLVMVDELNKLGFFAGEWKYQGYCGHCEKWEYINYEKPVH